MLGLLSKENERNGAFDRHGKTINASKVWSENSKGDLAVDGRTVLKWILQKSIRESGLD
jgi:hypothetical protein